MFQFLEKSNQFLSCRGGLCVQFGGPRGITSNQWPMPNLSKSQIQPAGSFLIRSKLAVMRADEPLWSQEPPLRQHVGVQKVAFLPELHEHDEARF
jgi:hypothetical protein